MSDNGQIEGNQSNEARKIDDILDDMIDSLRNEEYLLVIEYLSDNNIPETEFNRAVSGGSFEVQKKANLAKTIQHRNLLRKGLNGGRSQNFFIQFLLKAHHGYENRGKEEQARDYTEEYLKVFQRANDESYDN